MPESRTFRGRLALVATLLPMAAALAAPPAADAQTAAAAERRVVVHAGRLFDGTGPGIRERVSIVIAGDRIVGVEDGFVRPAGAEVVDLSTAFVMPGLIDSHTHLTSEQGGNAIVNSVTLSSVDAAVMGTVYARRTLEAGITTVRNVGAQGGSDIALRRAIDAGHVPGPRIWTARRGLSVTGGHGDVGGLRPDIEVEEWHESIVDSPDAAREAVRRQKKYGADLIKFTATGGVMSINDNGKSQLFNAEEMRAIVETAHMLGMKVAAHAHGKAGMDAAIVAGVDSIEHGTFMDDETIALFRKHGTYLVPTLHAGDHVGRLAQVPGALHPLVQKKAAETGPAMQAMFRKAYAAGVKIAFGTDCGVGPHGTNGREFRLMVEGGMPAVETLLAATRSAADLLGAADRVGSIQPGRFADIVAVAGDPLKDISEMERVRFVMKGGAVFKPWGAGPAPARPTASR